MSARLKPGENFLLNLQLRNDDESLITVAELSSFEVRAFIQGKLKKSWTWLPNDLGDEHLRLTNGLAELEVISELTASWLGPVHFEVLPSFVDGDYFVAGSQTDVVCLNGLVEFISC